jgi:hypothetical protein
LKASMHTLLPCMHSLLLRMTTLLSCMRVPPTSKDSKMKYRNLRHRPPPTHSTTASTHACSRHKKTAQGSEAQTKFVKRSLVDA